ncbi:threonine synthase [Aliiglaciecola sp. M165]|uniref:threonine synthase n=1 Tax=Aliiglaciecola sp. M165 TaxID=2593649 RepID=UPI001180C363|nr:threonine synthase [Aliiglaciecola sp. M165]TRY32132.1 threonine synthase [Aliiglaciecola sp. M165]
MKYVKHLVCTECGTQYPVDRPMNLCPKDNRPVQMVLDIQSIKEHYKGMDWYHPNVANMWRFGPLLPFDIGTDKHKVCTLGEGHTPLIDVSAYSCFETFFDCIYFKEEGQPYEGFGANPTGSFKDRGMAMVATMAKHFGLNKLVVPTQGNAGDSLSEYGQHYGFEVAVVMPDDTPMPIMGKVAAYSVINDKIKLDLVKGTIREAGALMKEKYLPQGFFNCATFQEPGWRIEGKKTMGLELAEPNQMSREWELPDVVFYPIGGGTGILGMWKAFDELEQLGVINAKRPKIIAVQSEANAPIVDAMDNDLEDTIATNGGQTLATGLNVPGGVGQKAVLAILRQSQGAAIAVSETQIAQHTQKMFKQFSMLIGPEGAATIAAVEIAKKRGLVFSTDRIVCFNTGSAEKYFPNVRHLFSV